MIAIEPPDILSKPLSVLLLSDDLHRFMETQEYRNLGELLNSNSASELLKQNGFDYHCLTELYWILEHHGCENLLA